MAIRVHIMRRRASRRRSGGDSCDEQLEREP
jgi:hypothetical protein